MGVACFFAKISGIICQKSIFFEVQVTDILNMYHLCILPWSLGFRTIYIIINYAFCLNARLSLKCILDLKWKSVNQNSIKKAPLYEKHFVFDLLEGAFFLSLVICDRYFPPKNRYFLTWQQSQSLIARTLTKWQISIHSFKFLQKDPQNMNERWSFLLTGFHSIYIRTVSKPPWTLKISGLKS